MGQAVKEDTEGFHQWQHNENECAASRVPSNFSNGPRQGAAAWWEGILENSKTRLKQKKVQHWSRVNCDGGSGVQAEELGCLAWGWGRG